MLTRGPDYADNMDAREYDRRLRGPVDEETELAIDERNGLKNYIANERAGIDTSAGLVRKLFGRSIELARRYRQDGNKDDFYEALRLLGTGCHCLEGMWIYKSVGDERKGRRGLGPKSLHRHLDALHLLAIFLSIRKPRHPFCHPL